MYLPSCFVHHMSESKSRCPFSLWASCLCLHCMEWPLLLLPIKAWKLCLAVGAAGIAFPDGCLKDCYGSGWGAGTNRNLRSQVFCACFTSVWHWESLTEQNLLNTLISVPFPLVFFEDSSSKGRIPIDEIFLLHTDSDRIQQLLNCSNSVSQVQEFLMTPWFTDDFGFGRSSSLPQIYFRIRRLHWFAVRKECGSDFEWWLALLGYLKSMLSLAGVCLMGVWA